MPTAVAEADALVAIQLDCFVAALLAMTSRPKIHRRVLRNPHRGCGWSQNDKRGWFTPGKRRAPALVRRLVMTNRHVHQQRSRESIRSQAISCSCPWILYYVQNDNPFEDTL